MSMQEANQQAVTRADLKTSPRTSCVFGCDARWHGSLARLSLERQNHDINKMGHYAEGLELHVGTVWRDEGENGSQPNN
jgi:hypothetical protein